MSLELHTVTITFKWNVKGTSVPRVTIPILRSIPSSNRQRPPSQPADHPATLYTTFIPWRRSISY